jgi:hypothetical protein
MTDPHDSEEGAEEAIEDLEPPAEAQSDVAGGDVVIKCTGANSALACMEPTCIDTKQICHLPTDVLVTYDQ